MVFCVRETLTEEDREAWRRMAMRREKIAREKRRAEVWKWAKDKLAVLPGMMFCAVGLYAVSLGRGALSDRIYVGGFSLLSLCMGIVIFAVDPYPAREPDCLPQRDFLSFEPSQVRAAFFGDGRFIFWESGAKVRLSYQAVVAAWEDRDYFYLFLEDHPSLVLPKRGLGRWMPEDFRDFLEREFGRPVERIE